MSVDEDAPRRWQAVHDGVAYQMALEKVGNRYFASWLCAACVELSGSTLRGDTPEEAIERANDRLIIHQKHVHGAGPIAK
jgi:hypothetical protein